MVDPGTAGNEGFKMVHLLFDPDCIREGGFFVEVSNTIRPAEYHAGECYRGRELQESSNFHQERAAGNGGGSPTYFDWAMTASGSEGMPQSSSNNLGAWPAMDHGPSSGAQAEMAPSVLILSSLSVLQQKTQQLEAFVQQGRHDQPASASGLVSSILYELIATAASLLLSVRNREGANLASTDVQPGSGPGRCVVIQGNNQAPPLGLGFGKLPSPNVESFLGFAGGNNLEDEESPSDIRAEGEEEEAAATGETFYVEINEADILAEHVHFCEMCGKGFRREASVRMHMRTHGDEYKTNQALMSKPLAASSSCSPAASRYSCPSERCRRNKNHRNFKALKSIASLRNHYKRSHCPRIYTCQKCDRQFSLLGDLKTHGNHCGHKLWRCSCGTTFTRKDKLFSHVALFHGNNPLPPGHEVVLPPAPKLHKATNNVRPTMG